MYRYFLFRHPMKSTHWAEFHSYTICTLTLYFDTHLNQHKQCACKFHILTSDEFNMIIIICMSIFRHLKSTLSWFAVRPSEWSLTCYTCTVWRSCREVVQTMKHHPIPLLTASWKDRTVRKTEALGPQALNWWPSCVPSWMKRFV